MSGLGAGGLIGKWSNAPMACGATVHLLATGNPWLRATWCVCGQVRVSGLGHETWHQRLVYDGVGRGATLIGYDRYSLGECLCHKGGAVEVGACGYTA